MGVGTGTGTAANSDLEVDRFQASLIAALTNQNVQFITIFHYS
jgi:hypothetical protein